MQCGKKGSVPVNNEAQVLISQGMKKRATAHHKVDHDCVSPQSRNKISSLYRFQYVGRRDIRHIDFLSTTDIFRPFHGVNRKANPCVKITAECRLVRKGFVILDHIDTVRSAFTSKSRPGVETNLGVFACREAAFRFDNRSDDRDIFFYFQPLIHALYSMLWPQVRRQIHFWERYIHQLQLGNIGKAECITGNNRQQLTYIARFK